MTVYHINRFYAGMTPNDTLDEVGAATKVVGDVMRDFAALYASSEKQAITYSDPGGTFKGAFGMFSFPVDSTKVYGLMMQRTDNSTSDIRHAIWLLDAFGVVQSQMVLIEYQISGGTFSPGGFPVYPNSAFTFFRLKDSVSFNKRVYYVNQFGTSDFYLSYTPADSSQARMYRLDAGGNMMRLTGLTYSDIVQMRVVFDRLYVTNGNYIAQVDDDGVFTEKRFTLPTGWRAIDFDVVGTYLVIIARRDDTNEYQGLFWDMVTTSGYESNFSIPLMTASWVRNFGDQIYIAGGDCSRFSIYRLSYSAPGATLNPVGSVGIASELANCFGVSSDKRTVAVGTNKMTFEVNTADLSGVFAFGRLDASTPFSLSCLYETTKRIYFTFPTRDYFFFSEYDGGTDSWTTSKAFSGDYDGEAVTYESKTFGNPYTHSRVKQAILTLKVSSDVIQANGNKQYEPKVGVKVDGGTTTYWLTPVSGSQHTPTDGTTFVYRASGVPIGRFYRVVVQLNPISPSTTIPRIGISSISLDVQDNKVFS